MKKFYNSKNWINFSKKLEPIRFSKEMLDAVKEIEKGIGEILSILEEEIAENKKIYWLLADKCSENAKLKEKIEDLKSQTKNRKKEENENN